MAAAFYLSRYVIVSRVRTHREMSIELAETLLLIPSGAEWPSITAAAAAGARGVSCTVAASLIRRPLCRDG